jgi:protein involved in polysaccharide export with SLBB domain
MRSLSLALSALLTVNIAFAQRAEPRVARAVAANAQTAPAPGVNSSAVVLRPNDVFELRLSGMPQEDSNQFGGAQTVGSDGLVNILYAGRIQAAGRTPAELEKAIEKQLVDKKIFRWPTATINIATQLRYVTIGGTVRAPQRTQWSADLTLSSALMVAGGGGDFSSDKVHLIRGGKVTVYSVKKLRRDPTEDPKLLPGDSIELQ